MTEFRPVVILDDDEDDLKLLEEAYSLTDCRQPLLTFSTVTDFFRTVDGKDAFMPSVVISDWVIPPYTGEGLLTERQSKTALEGVPFVFLSSSVTDSMKSKALSLGATDCFEKPSSFNSIQLLIKDLVKRFCQTDANEWR